MVDVTRVAENSTPVVLVPVPPQVTDTSQLQRWVEDMTSVLTVVTGSIDEDSELGVGTQDGELKSWNSGEWVTTDELLLGATRATYATYDDSDLGGKVFHTRREPFEFDGKIGSNFYIIGDSLTSPNGNGGSISITYSTDGSGNITSQAITDAGSGYSRDFVMSVRGANSSGSAGV